MANSCGGADDSVPPEVEEAVKAVIRRNPNHREFFDATDANGGQYSCLLEDLGGIRCAGGKCQYNREAKPTPNHTSKKRI